MNLKLYKGKESAHPEPLLWEGGRWWRGELPFIPKIFALRGSQEEVPPGWEGVLLSVDPGDLWHYREAFECAERFCERGLFLLWDLDLGLYEDAPPQRLLSVARERLFHFKGDMGERFVPYTLGLCLYRGPLVPTGKMMEGLLAGEGAVGGGVERLLIAKTALESLLLQLAVELPATLPLFTLEEAEGCSDLLLEALLLAGGRMTRFGRAVRGAQLPSFALPWGDRLPYSDGVIARRAGSWRERYSERVALALPSLERCLPHWDALNALLRQLLAGAYPFRIIDEECLTAEWEGLDLIIAFAPTATEPLLRQLQGFAAAGGTIAAAGGAIERPKAVPWQASLWR